MVSARHRLAAAGHQFAEGGPPVIRGRRVMDVRSRSVSGSERVVRGPFVRRAVSRFMPGERLDDALRAAADLQRLGIGAVLTRLGENVTDAAAADETTRHYVTVCAEASARSLDCDISVKLTQ